MALHKTTLLICIAFLVSIIHAQNRTKRMYALCPPHFEPIGGQCYYISDTKENWLDAHFACKDRNSRLAEPIKLEDRKLRKYLQQMDVDRSVKWIGGRFNWAKHKWQWGYNGNLVTYQSFSQMIPGWSARSCVDKYHFVCQHRMPYVSESNRYKIYNKWNESYPNEMANEIEVVLRTKKDGSVDFRRNSHFNTTVTVNRRRMRPRPNLFNPLNSGRFSESSGTHIAMNFTSGRKSNGRMVGRRRKQRKMTTTLPPSSTSNAPDDISNNIENNDFREENRARDERLRQNEEAQQRINHQRRQEEHRRRAKEWQEERRHKEQRRQQVARQEQQAKDERQKSDTTIAPQAVDRNERRQHEEDRRRQEEERRRQVEERRQKEEERRQQEGERGRQEEERRQQEEDRRQQEEDRRQQEEQTQQQRQQEQQLNDERRQSTTTVPQYNNQEDAELREMEEKRLAETRQMLGIDPETKTTKNVPVPIVSRYRDEDASERETEIAQIRREEQEKMREYKRQQETEQQDRKAELERLQDEDKFRRAEEQRLQEVERQQQEARDAQAEIIRKENAEREERLRQREREQIERQVAERERESLLLEQAKQERERLAEDQRLELADKENEERRVLEQTRQQELVAERRRQHEAKQRLKEERRLKKEAREKKAREEAAAGHNNESYETDVKPGPVTDTPVDKTLEKKKIARNLLRERLARLTPKEQERFFEMRAERQKKRQTINTTNDTVIP